MARCTAFLRSERVVVPAKAVAATALYCLIGSLVYAYARGKKCPKQRQILAMCCLIGINFS